MNMRKIPLTQDMLKERALEYQNARVVEKASDLQQVLIFALADEWYSFSLEHLQETLQVPEITELPNAPPSVAGLVHLRGELLLTFDLRKVLGRPEDNPPSHIIVLDYEGYQTGLLVETIQGVDEILVQDLQSHMEASSGIHKNYVQGMMLYQGKPLFWLKVSTIAKTLKDNLG